MKRTPAAACIMGALAGYLLALGGHPQQAVGQQPPKPVVWEYKAEPFFGNGISDDCEDRFTRRLNTLAADGWEYVGPIAQSESGQTGHARPFNGYVAFRRPKR